MEEPNPNMSAAAADPSDVSLLDYLEVAARRKKMIAGTTLVAALLSSGITLLLPDIYSSTALIIPPAQDQGLLGMMMGQTGGGMASMAGDLLGKGTSADQYVTMLNSNAIADRIIDRFKLMEVYHKKYRTDTYRALEKRVDVAAGKKDGIVSITVEDQNPKRAAEMANAYVEELNRLTAGINVTDAGQNQAFLEDRLVKAKADLAKAEDAVKAFQSKTKLVDVNEQAQVTIGSIAQLKAQLVSQEVMLGTLQRQFTDTSQEVKSAKASIANLRSQMARLEGNGSGGVIPGVGAVPEMGQQYLRLMREFKMQEALVEVLTKQYEMAKLSAAKDVGSIRVVQQGRVPDRKVKPKRSSIVLASSFTAGFMSLLFALLREYGSRLSEAERQRCRRIKALLTGR